SPWPLMALVPDRLLTTLKGKLAATRSFKNHRLSAPAAHYNVAVSYRPQTIQLRVVPAHRFHLFSRLSSQVLLASRIHLETFFRKAPTHIRPLQCSVYSKLVRRAG